MNSSCYHDADCPESKVCLITGESGGICTPMCSRDEDCNGGICDGATSTCSPPECSADLPCAEGFNCEDGRCQIQSESQLTCPADMASIDNSYCMDIFEASRVDATESSAGIDSSVATSRPGVLPWQVIDNETASLACQAAGKALCTESQWYRACVGPSETLYSYGNEYDPETCNGIDTYCYCDSGTCKDAADCPFPGCYTACGAAFRLMPTGSLGNCTNEYGIFDINGNLWEHTANGDDSTVRGGAFNCLNSERLHACTYIPGNWTPSARGFRCCSPGIIDTITDTDTGTTGDES